MWLLISRNFMDSIHDLKYIRLLGASETSLDELNEAFEEFAHTIHCQCVDNGSLGKVYFWLNHIKVILMVNKYRHEHYRAHIHAAIQYTDSAIEWVCKSLPEKKGESEGTTSPANQASIRWTDDTIHLMEVLYACHELKQFNDGCVTLKDLIEYVCNVFGVDVKNASSYYARMRRRKAEDRTYFIDRLREALLKRMERDDEKQYNRTK